MIAGLGILCTLIGLAGMLLRALGVTGAGGSVLPWLIVFMGGVQLTGTGVIGEYIGKTYQEVKRRPRYMISQRTTDKK